jgi:hypothetical protein
MTRDQNYHQGQEQYSLTGQLSTKMRVHAGTGVIISWESDCSPQVMTGITPSSEPELR